MLMPLINITQNVLGVGVCIRGVLEQEILSVISLHQSSMPCSMVQPFEPSGAYSALHGLRDGFIVLSTYCFAQLWGLRSIKLSLITAELTIGFWVFVNHELFISNAKP
jgi:hypothetical protein